MYLIDKLDQKVTCEAMVAKGFNMLTRILCVSPLILCQLLSTF